jgi:hypothetical protein
MPTKKSTSGSAIKVTSPRLKNYASEASEESIFEAIRKTLALHKARRIVFDYDDAGRAISIEFTVTLGKTPYVFKLPARFDEAEPLVAEARKAMRMSATSGEKLRDQTYRAVWATIRDWIDAQMALIDIGAVRLEEVFLPYLLVDQGKTMFERFAEQRQLPSPNRTVITEVTEKK